MSPLQTTAVVVITALAFGAVVRVIVAIGFYLLAAYIVHKTGKTSDVAAIGRAVGALVAARSARQMLPSEPKFDRFSFL